LSAACVYEGVARTAVLTLKFRSGRYLAPLMAELMCESLARRPMRCDVVIPVPLAPRRLRDRGFNQAALLAAQLARRGHGRLVDNALERAERPPQQSLGANERQTNLQGTIRCRRPDFVRGCRVLLVDDVVTTGATLSACADSLAAAGARRILALAFARDL
jgi:ComF family protein